MAAKSFPEHLERTRQREKRRRPEKIMLELDMERYIPETDELEKNRRRHEPKELCQGSCGKEYTITTLTKYNGMCCRCRESKENKTGHYDRNNALKKGHYKNATSQWQDEESEESDDSSSDYEPDSSSDNDENNADKKHSTEDEKEEESSEEEEEETITRIKAPRKITRGRKFTDETFVAPENWIEEDYSRPNKRKNETELEAEQKDLLFEQTVANADSFFVQAGTKRLGMSARDLWMILTMKIDARIPNAAKFHSKIDF